MKHLIYSVIFLFVIACSPSNSQEKAAEAPQDFNNYWYAGKAEITSFDLKQSRYGEIHTGKAVSVFVTEPFSKSKQVKLDNWKDQSPDNVSVLKLNMTKKFLTGIYPYSMMMSTFTPVSSNTHPHPFKITTSLQEWCGHTWMQLNLEDDAYRLRGYSYFETEGDLDMKVPSVLLEDELWTRIRLNPETLPTGKVELLPSTFYLRLKHQPNKPVIASLTLSEVPNSDYSKQTHKKYTIEYKDRDLTIYFESQFPHTILGWEETYQGLTTTAKRINTIQSAYWGENSNGDRAIRKKLGLTIE